MLQPRRTVRCCLQEARKDRRRREYGEALERKFELEEAKEAQAEAEAARAEAHEEIARLQRELDGDEAPPTDSDKTA